MEFLQAANFTPTNGRTIDLLVEHDMEAPETGTTAEAVARYFAHQVKGPKGSSAHFNIDNNSVVQSVFEKDVAWHAPGANHNGIGFEHAGYAKQTRAEWLDGYSKATLDRSIGLQIVKVAAYSIPVVRLAAADLRAGKRGLTGHADVSAAFHRSTHTDPGAGFPWDYLVDGIRQGVRSDHEGEPAVEFVALLPGDSGWRVRRMQRLLDALPYVKVTVDGTFGDLTERAVKQLQRRHNIKETGRVGKPTWLALLAAQDV